MEEISRSKTIGWIWLTQFLLHTWTQKGLRGWLKHECCANCLCGCTHLPVYLLYLFIHLTNIYLLLYVCVCVYIHIYTKASLVAQMVKNLPVMQVFWVCSLGWEDPLEKGMATHSYSSSLAWRIPWPKSMELQRTGHDWATNTHTHTHTHTHTRTKYYARIEYRMTLSH